MRFVIIGGDAAGMSAASRAKRNDADLEVVVLEQSSDVSYSACGMPYNLADPKREMDDLIVRRADVFREKQGIDLRLGHKVLALDPAAKKISGGMSTGGLVESGELPFEVEYDKLLIATGARPIVLDVPGKDLPGVLPLKSLEDGRRLKGYLALNNVKKAAIVGMGYIGLEMAEALHERGVAVTMIDVLPRLIPWAPEEMAELLRKELESKGVELRFSSRVKAFEKGGERLIAKLDNGEVEADMIVVAVGVAPNSEFAAAAGLDLGPAKSIAVDKSLLTSAPDVYAAGDCADAFHVITGKRVWIPLALRANRAGWAVGDNVTGKTVELPGIMGSAVFKCLDMEVARTGLSLDEAKAAGFNAVDSVIKSRSRAHSHPGNQTIHIQLVAEKGSGRLLGGVMVGKEGVAHRIDSLAVALHAGMTVPEFFQCDMAYAPPFSPVWDPLLTAANQILKKL